MKRLGLFPTMTYYLTSSMEKYIRLCDLMSPFGYVVFRQDYMLPEVQGDPLYVALVKAKRMRLFEVNYIVEDTSLMLSKLGYTAGAYIKDMMKMGSDTFSKIFFLGVELCGLVLLFVRRRKIIMFQLLEWKVILVL